MSGEVDTRPGVLRCLGVAMFAKLQRWPAKHCSKELSTRSPAAKAGLSVAAPSHGLGTRGFMRAVRRSFSGQAA